MRDDLLMSLDSLSSPAIWLVNPDAPCGITVLKRPGSPLLEKQTVERNL